MRQPRVFSPRQNIRVGSSVKLEDQDVYHVRNSLRLRKGDEIIIFNGNREFLAELNIVRKDFITAKVKSIVKDEKWLEKRAFNLYIGLLKAGKLDNIIKMLTELGIDKITPVQMEYSQVKKDAVTDAKTSRWNNLAIAASKQCKRISVPVIAEPIFFNDLITKLEDEENKFVFLPSVTSNNILKISENKLEVNYIIGPEGGFSPAELLKLKKINCTEITINSNVLRSETAAVSALSVLKYLDKN